LHGRRTCRAERRNTFGSPTGRPLPELDCEWDAELELELDDERSVDDDAELDVERPPNRPRFFPPPQAASNAGPPTAMAVIAAFMKSRRGISPTTPSTVHT